MACEAQHREYLANVAIDIMKDPVAAQYISVAGYHGYDGGNFDAVSKFASSYPNVPLWMTELCDAGVKPDYRFLYGEKWGKIIFDDLDHSASAWIYWNMILDQNGGPWLVSEIHHDPVQNSQQALIQIDTKSKTVTYTGPFWYLSHFSKFVRPGYIKIDSNPARSNNLFAIAFKSADGNNTVTNLMNTNDTAKIVNIKCKDRYVTISMPAHSITTLSWMD
jgi:glucosylceramidase